MSDTERPSHKLLRDLHDLEGRYGRVKNQPSANELFALWSALWQFSERAIADHRQLKANQRKRQQQR